MTYFMSQSIIVDKTELLLDKNKLEDAFQLLESIHSTEQIRCERE